jgi:hypothetical protein
LPLQHEYQALVTNVAQQKEAATILDKIESIKRLQAETATELDAMLPSILDKAFKGKLIE